MTLKTYGKKSTIAIAIQNLKNQLTASNWKIIKQHFVLPSKEEDEM